MFTKYSKTLEKELQLFYTCCVLHLVLQIGECMKSTSNHHLVRVRMNKKLFEHLRQIAQTETEITGEFVSVSDIIRSACLIWKQTYETTKRIKEKRES
jgi:hypothetical protein